MKNRNYQPIIGLEIHVELSTKTKMFCKCPAAYFGAKPNTHTCPVCLGLPGALPYPNKKAIESCVMIALALNCKITDFSYFERKNYFYPDLPKGFQISQYIHPFGHNGLIEIKNQEKIKKIRIRRVHMEEDTAKLMHESANEKNEHSLIDFNRSGVPLVEIVTEPDITSGEEAKIFLTKLQKIIRYLDVSDADMEKGHMRLEPNISLLYLSADKVTNTTNNFISDKDLPNYKVEVKNINSFRFVEKAINYEIARQTKILDEKKTPDQETRGWNEAKASTVSQRTKEEAHDYRYFPEPDIPPVKIDQKDIQKIKNKIPELPDEKIKRFINNYRLSIYDAEIVTREKNLANYFEDAVKTGKEFNVNPKQIANNIINKKINIEKIPPLELIKSIAASTQTQQIEKSELDKIIKEVINENSKAVGDYKTGKIQVLGYLIGMLNKKLVGKKVDPKILKNSLIDLLKD